MHTQATTTSMIQSSPKFKSSVKSINSSTKLKFDIGKSEQEKISTKYNFKGFDKFETESSSNSNLKKNLSPRNKLNITSTSNEKNIYGVNPPLNFSNKGSNSPLFNSSSKAGKYGKSPVNLNNYK